MDIKKSLFSLFCSFAVVGCAGGMGDGCCGWSGLDITGSGQVKTVRHTSPIVCPDYYEVDISLGVMRNGVGSMSTQDKQFYIPDNMVPELKKAAANGSIVEFTYDERRSSVCVPDDRLKSFKIVQ
jgi:hypothetical protein